jgi:hypothetical protein
LFVHSIQHYTFFAGPLSFDTKGYVDGLPKLMYNQDSWTKVNIYYFSLSFKKLGVYGKMLLGINTPWLRRGRACVHGVAR